MRFFRMFLLQFQHVLEARARSFVWFSLTVINPILFILFWSGALEGKTSIGGWTIIDFNTYYFLLIIASSLLSMHVEESVAFDDIQQGGMVRFLTRPISYYWIKFVHELPYRVLQGSFGIMTGFIFVPLLGGIQLAALNPVNALGTIVVVLLALMISFTFKMIIGLLAFWLINVQGIFNTIFVITVVVNGSIMPLDLYPQFIRTIALLTPFPYITYYPIITVQGRLSPPELLVVILSQLVWLISLNLAYNILWKKGVRKFTAVGQ